MIEPLKSREHMMKDQLAQSPDRIGPDPAVPILSSDLERELPLSKEYSISVDNAISRVVNVGRLAGNAIQLYDLKSSRKFKVLKARGANVEAAKVEALDASAYLVDRGLESIGQEPVPFTKYGTARMRSDVDQTDDLTLCRDRLQALFVRFEVMFRHAYRTFIPEDKRLKRLNTIAGNRGEHLFGDRKYPAVFVVGLAVIEDARFDAIAVLLQNVVAVEVSEVFAQLRTIANYGHALSAFAGVGFEDKREREPVRIDEFHSSASSLLRIGSRSMLRVARPLMKVPSSL